jgi:guanine deaminase
VDSSDRGELLRGHVFHTPANPFLQDRALVCHWDGALFIRDGRVAACGDYTALRAAHPDAAESPLSAGFLLPGLIDTHIHFPQLHVLGNLGLSLLDWLEQCALPEEERMADDEYARNVACAFVRALASHGTTTAQAFGAHFPQATAALFEAAERSGLRLIGGLVLSDRALRPALHQTPQGAYEASTALIRRFHQRGRLLYAVTPRFALSASEAILEVCQTLLREQDGLRAQTHLNENSAEIAEVARLFPWAADYFAVYERFGLSGPNVVMAHNLHPSESELGRLAATRTSVAHCPWSNAALGSGLFPLRRHLNAGVPFALGTDVGAGGGFSVLKEALHAYLYQRIASGGFLLGGAHLLYLATRAGAEALGLAGDIGDFQIGKAADFVYLRPPEDSPLAAIVQRAESPERALSALFTLAGQESIAEVRVAGSVVYHRG